MRQSVVFIVVIALALLSATAAACSGPSPTPTPTGPETVTFSDKNLEAAIRDTLGKPPGEEIITTELVRLITLEDKSTGIANISGLQYCINLTYLVLDDNQIGDISPLASLTSLTLLSLNGNQISDVSSLASLTELTVLYLGGNQISDISPLVENSGLGEGDVVRLEGNNLDLREGSEDMENIRALEDRGVAVYHDLSFG